MKKWTCLIILLLVFFFGLRYLVWLTTVHEVLPPMVYRSGQLTNLALNESIETYKIRSILNLRGPHFDKSWYRDELEIAQTKGIRHYDMSMNAHALPSQVELNKLVKLLLTSPKPLLIHCAGGADRTSLASTIYLILQNRPLGEASVHYSYRYYVFRQNSVARLLIPIYGAWLNQHHFQSSRQHFLQWLAQYP